MPIMVSLQVGHFLVNFPTQPSHACPYRLCTVYYSHHIHFRKIFLQICCLFMADRFLVCQLWFLCRLDIFWLIFQHSLHMQQYGHRVLRPHTSPCPYRLCTVYLSHHFHLLLDQGNLLRGIVNLSGAA